MSKITWEDILGLNEKDNNFGLTWIYDKLKQAEAEGKCCLNPPDKEEIFEIIKSILKSIPIAIDWDRTRVIYYNDMALNKLAEAIEKRIKEGK